MRHKGHGSTKICDKHEHGSAVISRSMVLPDVWLLAQAHFPVVYQG